MTVYVSKAGVFSALGHDHEISVPIMKGTFDAAAHHVDLRMSATGMRVRDTGISEKDRAEIQHTMLGSDVLDAEHHPEIVFRSTSAQSTGAGAWTVRGDLTLHGFTQPVTVEVHEKDGHFVGSSTFKQSEFGVKPVKVAGGTIRVKDEVRIEFDVQVARE